MSSEDEAAGKDTAASLAIRAALDVARPQTEAIIATAKTNFMAQFGNWVAGSHRDELESIFEDCGRAKLAQLGAATEAEAREWGEVYETALARIETLGLAVWITGQAIAVGTLRATIHQILQTVAATIAAVVGALVGNIPGVGIVAGPAAGFGTKFVLSAFFDKLAPDPNA